MEQKTASHDPTGNTKAVGSWKIKARDWQITINEIDNMQTVWDYITQRSGCTYAIACVEVAPTTGHVHGHIFAQFNNTVALSPKKCCNAHLEKCRGTPQENVDYIKKGGEIWDEFGTLRTWGGLNPTIKNVKEMSDKEIYETLPANYINCVRKIKNEIPGERYFKKVQVEWHYGPTGTGKTRYAFEMGCTAVEYNNGFFTDWGDARKIVIEEMRGEIPYRILLKLTDGYHNYYTVNVKGGFKFVDLDVIIITSPNRPEDVYNKQVDKTDSINQLLRRINVIKKYSNDEPDPFA